jgi:hypothetical protein
MKDQNKNIQTEIEKTLACFDRLEKIKATPYFFTRLEARLETRRRTNTRLRGILQTAWMIALIVINIFSIIIFSSDEAGATTSRTDYLKEIASDLTIERSYIDPFEQNE